MWWLLVIGRADCRLTQKRQVRPVARDRPLAQGTDLKVQVQKRLSVAAAGISFHQIATALDGSYKPQLTAQNTLAEPKSP